MAHSLDLPVIVEGVETEGQRDILKDYGADMLQGYYFHYPLSIDDITRELSQKPDAIVNTPAD
jgi:EAL domain-containing protein (putative c-di-GMP-specific phosphodiesterase class I)